MRWTVGGKKKDDQKSFEIPEGCRPGTQIILRGRVTTSELSGFSVNLSETENYCEGDILLHFNPRPPAEVVVRNTWLGGSWGGEERHQPHFPFPDGRSFLLRIEVAEDKFIAYVNGKPFMGFNHRADLHKAKYLILTAGAEYYNITFQEKYIMPYTTRVPRGMRVGKTFRIRGVVIDDAGFAVNFSDDAGNILFHFNPRPSEGCVVRNSLLGAWGGEEREGEFPFMPEQYFDSTFVCLEDMFAVFVNGEPLFEYAHRADFNDISQIQVTGNVNIIDMEGMEPAEEGEMQEVESGLEKGDVLLVHAMMRPDGERFAINFMTGTSGDDDVAFHFNPRRGEEQVVMNNRESGAWQAEEREEIPPCFMRNEPFEVRIETKKNKFKVFVNGRKYCKFRMRTQVEEIKAIQITGSVFVLQSTLLKKLEKPVWEKFPGGLHAGSWIVIPGTPKKQWDRFSINFCCEGEDDCDIAFHFNPRKDEGCTVRNTREGGGWQGEERDGPDFPFEAKDTFELVTYVQEDKFVTYVNGQHYIDYNHRIPLDRICHLLMNGNANFYEPEFLA